MRERALFCTSIFRNNLVALSALAALSSTTGPALAYKWVTYDEDGTKHIHAPFVNVAVKKHADGTKDVDVQAPFTNVHNPAGGDNAEVHAPFTDIEPRKPSTLPSTPSPSPDSQSPSPNSQPSSSKSKTTSENRKSSSHSTNSSSSTRKKKPVTPETTTTSPQT